jgi:hypothetical protein
MDVKSEKRDLLEYSIADLVAIAYQRGMEGGSIEGEATNVMPSEPIGVNVGVDNTNHHDIPALSHG